jgi:hypothetical protein
MADQRAAELELLRNRLCGRNLKKTLSAKGISKYRISKDCSISYRSLCYWQKGFWRPSDKNVLIIARYLGLISPDQKELFELSEKLKALQQTIERISSLDSDSISK